MVNVKCDQLKLPSIHDGAGNSWQLVILSQYQQGREMPMDRKSLLLAFVTHCSILLNPINKTHCYEITIARDINAIKFTRQILRQFRSN